MPSIFVNGIPEGECAVISASPELSFFTDLPADPACSSVPHAIETPGLPPNVKLRNRPDYVMDERIPPRTYRRIFIVFKATSDLHATGVWNAVETEVLGVYETIKDANDRVDVEYEVAKGGRTEEEHGIRYWGGKEGVGYKRWCTSGVMIEDCHVRVWVERWRVQANKRRIDVEKKRAALRARGGEKGKGLV